MAVSLDSHDLLSLGGPAMGGGGSRDCSALRGTLQFRGNIRQRGLYCSWRVLL